MVNECSMEVDGQGLQLGVRDTLGLSLGFKVFGLN